MMLRTSALKVKPVEESDAHSSLDHRTSPFGWMRDILLRSIASYLVQTKRKRCKPWQVHLNAAA
jgi:hypothetical protein